MSIFYGCLAFVVGLLMNIQSGANGQLRQLAGNPIFASAVNFAVGSAAMLLMLAWVVKGGQYPLPRRDVLKQTGWWMWMGGPLGVLFVMGGVLLPPVIGYGAFFSMLVTGQLVFSVIVDHFGWFRTLKTPLNRRRMLGLALLLIGALLVQNT